MPVSFVLSRYIAWRCFASVALAFGSIACVVLLIDIVNLGQEVLPRAQASFGLVLEMALLRMPFLAQKTLPFAMLSGTMLAYVWLTRTHELVVSRAAGVSAWQFLLPSLAVALLIGSVAVTAFNPLASAMVTRFERLEAALEHGQGSLLEVRPGGLWLREGAGGRQLVIHAREAAEHGTDLGEVVIFAFEDEDRFVERIDAAGARLGDGHWQLRDVLVTRPDATARTHATLQLPTALTAQRIQNSIAPPETMSFWDLPAFIRIMEEAGFSPRHHRIHWHAVLSLPLLLAAMVLVAAAFSLRLTRRGHVGLFVLAGVGCGFLLHFLSDVALALGMSGALPPVLAAWAPAAIFAMAGSALLFHLEDG